MPAQSGFTLKLIIMKKQLNLFKVAEIKLIYKPQIKASDRPKIQTPREVYNIFINHWEIDKIELKEEFKIMLFNRGNRVLGIVPISTGGVSGTAVDPKLVFSSALLANASALILAHNHPSGNLKPSEADTKLTKKLKSAGELLEIIVLDHFILTRDGYYSFSEDGII